VGSLFAADAWYYVGFNADELKDPKRDLAFSMSAGVVLVIFLYFMANVAYLSVLPASAIAEAPQDRVGTAALQAMFGDAGQYAMAIAIVISCFGANNGLILSGARAYYAMAQDGLFFKSVGVLHPQFRTPAFALWVQAAWSSVLCLSGTYGQLLDYVTFAVVLFFMLTALGLFLLRIRRPNAERPIKALGYPVLPGLYLLLTGLICVDLLIEKPQYTWPGLGIVALGVPVYYAWRRAARG
jgi:basic amino acid/polyamine antiporter, APA family